MKKLIFLALAFVSTGASADTLKCEIYSDFDNEGVQRYTTYGVKEFEVQKINAPWILTVNDETFTGNKNELTVYAGVSTRKLESGRVGLQAFIWSEDKANSKLSSADASTGSVDYVEVGVSGVTNPLPLSMKCTPL